MNHRKLVFICLIIFSISCKQSDKSKTVTTSETSFSILTIEPDTIPDNSVVAAGKIADLEPERLMGRWMRYDGVYTIEIRSVEADGKLDAGYFNPRPIHVENAEWKIAENRLLITIKLQDTNYPGSTYTLEYLPGDDYLNGNYFQAVEGTNYEVSFLRSK
jgi:hypothetical protein